MYLTGREDSIWQNAHPDGQILIDLHAGSRRLHLAERRTRQRIVIQSLLVVAVAAMLPVQYASPE